MVASRDEAFKARLETTVLATESELARASNPAAAVKAAEGAIALAAGRRDRMRVAQLQLRLAQANIRWGKTAEAEVALQRGIAVFEEERRSLSDEGRVSSRDELWGLFETSVQLAINKGDYDRAFAMAERARTRSLAEARRLPVEHSLASVRESLAAGDAIVALNQFDSELAVWVISRDRADVLRRPLARLDAQRLVARQQNEIWQELQTSPAGRELFNQIVKPVSDKLQGVTRLIIVPDSTFENVSFAALWDQSKGHYL